MEAESQPVEYQSPEPKRKKALVGDDVAYFAPMAAFLAFTWAAGHWPSLARECYIVKTILAAVLLILLREQYTKINWKFWWVGIIVGTIGVVQWVGMEKGLLHFWPNYWRPSTEVVDPTKDGGPAALVWTFLTIRLLGPALVVPFMEEYFWRDFLWRTIAAPNDFKMIPVGEWDTKSFVIVTLAFASVHIQWITAIVWGAMIAILLVRTRSLGACIIAHGLTNLLLGIYVLMTHDWQFW
jgi:CAAX prenyl protease-like protein